MYNMCNGRLGSRGERGCTSIHQTSDENRPLCKIVFFNVHQRYKYTYSIMIPWLNGLFPIHVNEIASTVDAQNKFPFIKTKGYYMH